MELKTQIRRYMLGILFMLALAKSIYAASAYQIFSNAVSWLGRPSFVLVVTLVMFFILLYAIFASGLGFVKAFTKEDKSLTKNGKLVAVSMSLISTLGVFGYGYATGGAYNMMAQLPAILGTFGTIAAWTVSVLIAALVWFLYKDLPMHMQKEDDALNKRRWMRIGLTLLCFGMSFWIFGNLLSKTDFSEFGVAFIFLGVISIFIGSVIKTDEERAQAKAEKEAGESGSSGTTSDGDTKKYGTVEGVVKDEDGPIGNATVTIDNRNPVTTDSSGKFVFGQQEFGNFNIKYEADKHATAVRNYTLDKNKLDLGEVILAK
ncbi:MAG: carboxypeptidase-like regulatory domain-containing protein, partial [Candidatus Woesearchaeota archaeon]